MVDPTDTVTVRLFSVLRERAGVGEVAVPATGVGSVGQVAEVVYDRYPQLVPYRETVRFALNQVYARPADAVAPGDEIALITPVSGG